jgi:GT2 family glycosyltransferase
MLRIISAREKLGLSYARNVGASAAFGRVLAFCDADDEVAPDWLQNLIDRCPRDGIVGGHLETSKLNSVVQVSWRASTRTEGGLPVGYGYLPFVIGANFAVDRQAYLSVGGFDERFIVAGDDTDFSWRLIKVGRDIAFAPDAVVHYRLRSTVWALAKQRFAYGRADVLLFKKHQTLDARETRRWLRDMLALMVHFDRLFRGRGPRGLWVRDLAHSLGRLRGSWEQRVWFP